MRDLADQNHGARWTIEPIIRVEAALDESSLSGHALSTRLVFANTMTSSEFEHSQTLKEQLRVSRLTELLRQARKADPQLGNDLDKEIAALMKRRTFGLVFEQHRPEAVELPGRAVRRGDKVRVLPPRGEVGSGDQRLWRVEQIVRVDGNRVAHLLELGSQKPESRTAQSGDLVVVAEFNDRIHPGLVETGRVERGGDKPFHTVINSENYHALEMLTYTHRRAIDTIYIDPPYNTGARDWKYNNDYVASDDDYRHSKWLAFMERRLEITRELLKPDDSVLIVTIDEHEVHRLRLLLEQTFPEAYIQMVTIVTNPKGVAQGRFARVEEYALYCFFGSAGVHATDDDLLSDGGTQRNTRFWKGLLRAGTNASPSAGLGMAYPIFIDPERGRVISLGRTLRERIEAGDVTGDPNRWLPGEREASETPAGLVAVWPLRRDGSLGVWQAIPETLLSLLHQGLVKSVLRPDGWAISYVPNGVRTKIDRGEVEITGYDEQSGAAILVMKRDLTRAKTVWKRARHDAGWHGSVILRKLLNARAFDFPKSLYATRDALEPVVTHKKDALILDFFAGSGTTAHAVAMLNRADGGRRRSISITNNEVGPEEQPRLRSKGLRPGDEDWETLGIFRNVTLPRIKAAFTGVRPDGEPADLEYEDGSLASEGFDENAAFFALTYEAPLSVRHNRAFERIAPMLWMRAGSQGRVITELGDNGWDVAETYGVLENLDQAGVFVARVAMNKSVRTAFIVTDDDSAFQMVCRDLPSQVLPVRLYEPYLQNFQLTGGR
mgnify:CR=1 FL=1